MYGITHKTISAIETIYDNPKTSISTSNGPKNLFSTLSGILQEDTIALYLFIIVVDYIIPKPVEFMKENGLLLNLRKSFWQLSRFITGLDYADNIELR